LGTRSDLAARIANELARDDLTSEIEKAIDDAIDAYTHERWWFLEAEATAQTVAGTPYVSLPSDFEEALFLSITDGATRIALTLRDREWYAARSLSSVSSSRPTDATVFGDLLYLWPTPNSVMTVNFSYIRKLATLLGSQENEWTGAVERLIRIRAERDLALHLIQDYEKAGILDAEVQRIYSEMRRRNTGRSGFTGRIRPYGF